jgi:hypothetical protein
VPGSIPKIIFEEFCNGKLFLKGQIPKAEQKYQNIPQLFSWSLIVCLAFIFYLPANYQSTKPGGTPGIHP